MCKRTTCLEAIHAKHSQHYLAFSIYQNKSSIISGIYVVITDPFDLCQNQPVLMCALRLNTTSLIGCNYPSVTVLCPSSRWMDGSLADIPLPQTDQSSCLVDLAIPTALRFLRTNAFKHDSPFYKSVLLMFTTKQKLQIYFNK